MSSENERDASTSTNIRKGKILILVVVLILAWRLFSRGISTLMLAITSACACVCFASENQQICSSCAQYSASSTGTKQIFCDLRNFVRRGENMTNTDNLLLFCNKTVLFINVLSNKTIILLNLVEYRLISATRPTALSARYQAIKDLKIEGFLSKRKRRRLAST